MNKKRAIHRILACLLTIVMLLSTLSLTGCSLARLFHSDADMFVTSLTEDDLESAMSTLERLRSQIEKGTNEFFIIITLSSFYDKLNFIAHEYQMAELLFYADTSDKEAYERYAFAEECYNTVRSEWISIFREVYNSDSSLKDTIFSGWSESELQIFAVDEECIALEGQVAEITREFLALSSEGDEWSEDVWELYAELVEANQKIAEYYGYESYYDYATVEEYHRDYTAEDRENFRNYVKEYLLPMAISARARLSEVRAELDEKELSELNGLLYGRCETDSEYLLGYKSLFGDTAEERMDYLLSGELLYRADSENAYPTAYATVSSYFSLPYVFLGRGCQDILALTHEMGHFVSYYHYPTAGLQYDIAELHSQGNEWLMISYLSEVVSEDVYDAFVSTKLTEALVEIIYSTIVDEFENKVYSLDYTPAPSEYEAIAAEVISAYEEFFIDNTTYVTPYEYIQRSAVPQAVYYLSYATSQMAALGLYGMALEDGTESAIDIFDSLLTEADTSLPFCDLLSELEIASPFDEETYVMLEELLYALLEVDESHPAA